MAKNEKTVTIGDENYTLCFNFMTLSTLEEETGVDLFKGMDEGVSVSTIGTLFWAALKSKHNLTKDQAFGLIDELGFVKTGELVAEGLAAYVDTIKTQPAKPKGAKRAKVA